MWFDKLTTNGIGKFTAKGIRKSPFALSLSKGVRRRTP
jgi:hypothetical protein